MRGWAANGAIKTKRAEKHINDLYTEVRTFFARDTHRVVLEKQGEWGPTAGVVRITEPVPVEWGAVVGDAVHNLRSTLDILSHQIGLATGTRKSKRSRQFFPIYDDVEKFKTNRLGEKQGLRKETVGLLARTLPFQGRDKPLCLLRDLDDFDKHEILPLVACSFQDLGYEIPFLGKDGKPMVFKTVAPRLIYPVEDGTVLWQIGASMSPVDMNPQPVFDIALSEPQIVEGKPVFPLLRELTGLVERIVATFSDKLT